MCRFLNESGLISLYYYFDFCCFFKRSIAHFVCSVSDTTFGKHARQCPHCVSSIRIRTGQSRSLNRQASRYETARSGFPNRIQLNKSCNKNAHTRSKSGSHQI